MNQPKLRHDRFYSKELHKEINRFKRTEAAVRSQQRPLWEYRHKARQTPISPQPTFHGSRPGISHRGLLAGSFVKRSGGETWLGVRLCSGGPEEQQAAALKGELGCAGRAFMSKRKCLLAGPVYWNPWQPDFWSFSTINYFVLTSERGLCMQQAAWRTAWSP